MDLYCTSFLSTFGSYNLFCFACSRTHFCSYNSSHYFPCSTILSQFHWCLMCCFKCHLFSNGKVSSVNTSWKLQINLYRSHWVNHKILWIWMGMTCGCVSKRTDIRIWFNPSLLSYSSTLVRGTSHFERTYHFLEFSPNCTWKGKHHIF